MRRGPAIILLLSLLFAFGYGAQRATVEGWRRLAEFRPAHFGAPRPTAGPAALSGRLVIVVLEGLGPPEAFALPSLDWLRERGSSLTVQVPPPGHAAPALATLLTGADPRYHGVMLNTGGSMLPADTLLTAARRAGLSTGGAGGPAVAALAEPGLDRWFTGTTPQQVVDLARPLLEASGPGVVLIHFDLLHAGAHRLRTPAPDSADYRDLLGEMDAYLVQILGMVDLKSATLLVTGLVPLANNNIHSVTGSVPLVLAGAGIKPGHRGTASLTDVAPTAAALLGAPTPMQSSGRPLVEVLPLEGRPADLVVHRSLVSKKAFADAALQSLGILTPAPDPPEAAADAEAYERTLQEHLSRAQFSEWKQGLLDRLAYVGGAILFLLLYLLVALRQPFGNAVLGGVLSYSAAFHLVFFVTGGRYSAAFRGLETLDPTLAAALGLRTAIAMTVASVVAGLLLSRREFKSKSYLSAAALHMTLSTAALIALPITAAVAIVGWEFPVRLPPSGLIIWFFVAALQVVVICYMSPVWALVTVGCQRAFQAIWPRREVGNPEVNADKVVRLRALRRTTEVRRTRP